MPTRRIADLVLDSATDYAVITVNPEGRITYWSKGAERVLGWTSDEILGAPASLFFTPEDVANNVPQREMRDALTKGRGNDERWHRRKDGTRFWASGEMLPLRDGDAEEGFLKIMRDRTAERAAQERLKISEARLALAIGAGQMAVWEWDMESGSVAPSPEFNHLLGLNPGATPTMEQMRQRFFPGEEGRFVESVFAALARGEHFIELEFRLLWPDGTVHWLLLRAEITLDGTNLPQRIVGVAMNIDERKHAQEMQVLLNQELSHRMKNQLAMVQGIVAQTLRRGTDLDHARANLIERVGVLSRAHDILLSGQGLQASLGAVIEQAVGFAKGGQSQHIAHSGPELIIGSRAALSLALIVHELTTNAVKYGALSAEGGRVEIGWEVQGTEGGDALVWSWTESGGPRVAEPERTGFGSRLIKGGIAGASSSVSMTYLPTGLCCTITVLLAGLLPDP